MCIIERGDHLMVAILIFFSVKNRFASKWDSSSKRVTRGKVGIFRFDYLGSSHI